MEIRKCQYCNKEFEVKHGHQKYCDSKCRRRSDNHKAYRKPAKRIEINKTCKECGTEFITNLKLQVFCSEKCSSKNYSKHKQERTMVAKLENWKANPLVCKQCGKEFIKEHALQTFCLKECQIQFNHENRNKEARAKYENKRYHTMMNSGGYDRSISVKELVKRNGLKCAICDKNTDVNDFCFKEGTFIAGESYPSVDHIFPVSKGGTHTWDNVQLAHRKCNTLKYNKISYKTKSGQMKLSV